MSNLPSNQRVERTGGSRLALLQFERQRRLPPVAHADRSARAHSYCANQEAGSLGSLGECKAGPIGPTPLDTFLL
jgi:hypothetical protein